ncbi:MAG: ROK family protein [Acetobacteraceae bacterium]|nr:ROK family protein [Acetobacteraceae bacterium]
MTDRIRLGVDLGGTKAEIVALGPDGAPIHRERVATPAEYKDIVEAVAGLVERAEAVLGARGTVGVGMPGSLSPATGLVRNSNTQCLNGSRFAEDLQARLKRQIRFTNDANCLALSEAADGAAAGHRVVFAAILGTGCGGGIALDGRAHDGPNRVAGEWGHTPLPWMTEAERAESHRCWCGRPDCLETWISGTALAAGWKGKGNRSAKGIEAAAAAGDRAAARALANHADRLARALAMIVNILDPDIIVLGGGVSNLRHLYRDLPGLMRPWVFGDVFSTPVVPAKHGDSSGVFGAARLWDEAS